MALPKKVWKNSRFDKGLGNLNGESMFWWSQNLDLEKTPPYLRVAQKLFKKTDGVLNPDLNSLPVDGALFGKYFGGTQVYQWMLTQGWGTPCRVFRYEYPNWVLQHTYYFGGRAYSMLGDSIFNTPTIGTEQGISTTRSATRLQDTERSTTCGRIASSLLEAVCCSHKEMCRS